VIHLQRIRGVSRNALYKSTFTYLLTYLLVFVDVATGSMSKAGIAGHASCLALAIVATVSVLQFGIYV